MVGSVSNLPFECWFKMLHRILGNCFPNRECIYVYTYISEVLFIEQEKVVYGNYMGRVAIYHSKTI